MRITDPKPQGLLLKLPSFKVPRSFSLSESRTGNVMLSRGFWAFSRFLALSEANWVICGWLGYNLS